MAPLLAVFLPRHAQSRVEHGVGETDELVHEGRGDVAGAQQEDAARPQHGPDRVDEGREAGGLDVVQADVAGDEVHARIRYRRGWYRGVVRERHEGAEPGELPALDDVDRRVAR